MGANHPLGTTPRGKFKAQDPVYRGLDVRQQMLIFSAAEMCHISEGKPRGDSRIEEIDLVSPSAVATLKIHRKDRKAGYIMLHPCYFFGWN